MKKKMKKVAMCLAIMGVVAFGIQLSTSVQAKSITASYIKVGVTPQHIDPPTG